MMARPVKFSPAVAKRICDRVSTGEPLKHVCIESWAPERDTVRHWCAAHPEFRADYTLAREFGAEALAEEMLETGDDALRVAESAVEGQNANAMVHAVKIKLDNRRWLLAHWAPRRYGDRAAVELTGARGEPLIPAEPDRDKVALALLALLRSGDGSLRRSTIDATPDERDARPEPQPPNVLPLLPPPDAVTLGIAREHIRLRLQQFPSGRSG